MGKHERKPKLVGPWRNLHLAVWLIGLAILAWLNWWWPGILVLIAISLVIEAALMRYAPQAFEKPELPQPLQPPSSEPPASATSAPAAPAAQAAPVAPAAPVSEHPFERLPSVCAKCGGPIRGHEVKWTGPQSADCPYCGANIQMERR